MKTSVTITLFIFWAIVTAILSAALITKSNCPVITDGNRPGNISGITLDAATVAKHYSANDCWVIIDGKVYDLTLAVNSHPGGPGTILKYCGKDGSQGFATKDRQPGKPHSGNANNMLDSFLLGNLGQTLSGQQLQDASTKVKEKSKNIPSGEREDDD